MTFCIPHSLSSPSPFPSSSLPASLSASPFPRPFPTLFLPRHHSSGPAQGMAHGQVFLLVAQGHGGRHFRERCLKMPVPDHQRLSLFPPSFLYPLPDLPQDVHPCFAN